MYVLFCHQNFPAQLGHIAAYLTQQLGWKTAFLTHTPTKPIAGIEIIQYETSGGARDTTHFCSRTFENAIWHCDGVYRAMKLRRDKPDLVVGHSGFGSTLFLRELYPDVPIINMFEFYYHPHGTDSDMDFRQDLNWPKEPDKFLRARCRNAMILLDLQNCDQGYTPTEFQKSLFPKEYHPKLEVTFDGIDRRVYHGFGETLRTPDKKRTIAGVEIDAGTRLVTYVSRGFESMRGFDIFMRTAKRIYQEYPNLKFVVVGTERIAYGGDADHLNGKSFKEWVLSREHFDLSKFIFTGNIPPIELGKLLASSDLHIYLTVPFVLSWSMMNAMSCAAVVLGSRTKPVQEMIRDGENGLLADFLDVEGFAQKAIGVLRNPAHYRPLGAAAEQMIASKYSMEVIMPQMVRMYEKALKKGRNG